LVAESDKGTPAEYRAGLLHAIAKGWLEPHESGTYVRFTQAGAELFAGSEFAPHAASAALTCGRISTGGSTDAEKSRRCCRHALARIHPCSRKSWDEDGVTNGERQIEIASRGTGVIEDAAANQASYSSAHVACASIGKGPPAQPADRISPHRFGAPVSADFLHRDSEVLFGIKFQIDRAESKDRTISFAAWSRSG
jgi:hypothetical protein